MGHYLATVNKDAAANLTDLPVRPAIGTMVQFIPRPGEMGARDTLPLVVTHHHGDGRISGIILVANDDMRDSLPMRQRGVERTYCWDWPQRPEMQSESAQVDALRAEMVDLKASVEYALKQMASRAGGLDKLSQRVKTLEEQEIYDYGEVLLDHLRRLQTIERNLGLPTDAPDDPPEAQRGRKR